MYILCYLVLKILKIKVFCKKRYMPIYIIKAGQARVLPLVLHSK